MKTLFITIIISIIANPVFGKTITATGKITEFSDTGKLVMQHLFQDMGIAHKLIPTKEEEIKPDKKKVAKKEKPAPEEKITPEPKPVPAPTPRKKTVKKEKSKGESLIERIKRKNREIMQKKQEKKKRDRFYSLINKNKKKDAFYDDLHKEKKATLKKWKNLINETRKRWKERQKEFAKNVDTYKENLFELDEMASDFSTSGKNIIKADKGKYKFKTDNDYFVIPGALDVPIRDQGKRPTCAAFSGARALETVLQANNISSDLSEQFIYWASKPKCQKAPCSKKGSWVGHAFRRSQNSSNADIPLEQNCPYIKNPLSGNETQIPLQSNCELGHIKVTGFKRLSNLHDVMNSIKAGEPVVAGFRLSPNFYFSRSLISMKLAKIKGATDSHAAGHALLLIGHIKLPEKYRKTEGEFCLLTANSWGEGWGTGGYGCLSERWVKHHLIKNALLAVNRILIL